MSSPSTPVSSAKPAGVARAAKDTAAAAFAKQQTADQALRDAQSRKARSVNLERLARRDPMIRELLEEHTALQATVEQLRQENAALKAAKG